MAAKVFTQKYGEVDYSVEIYLTNTNPFPVGGGSSVYNINPAAVLSLAVEDNFQSWGSGGHLAFMYLPNDAKPINKTGNSAAPAASTGSQTTTDPSVAAAEQNAETVKSYQFRADGFDTLRICLCPKIKPTTGQSSIPAAPVSLDIKEWDPKWTLSYVFSIYDVEDVDDIPGAKGPMSTYMKCLKLHLKDMRSQILETANLEYSTSLSPEGNSNSQLANGYAPQKTLTTGKILKELFNQALTDPDLGGHESLAVGDKEEDWDPGISDLFYTSPTQWFAMDDINYVYGQHVGTEPLKDQIYDMSLFCSRRADKDKDINKICLTHVSKFFEKAGNSAESPGEDQIEHFFVTSHTHEGGAPTGAQWFAPLGNAADRDLKTAKYGQIISYSFVDMSPFFNAKAFSNSPVYSVDLKTRTFDTKFQNNTIEKARELIGEKYIDKLYKSGQGKELFLPTFHTHKQKNKNVYPTFSLNHDQVESAEFLRQKNGITNLLYSGLFQNACICFSTFGLTHREAGKIIGIDNTNKAEKTDYNSKLFGQWFIVKVIHSFETGAYMNLIYALKMHRFEKAKTQFDKTY